MHFPKLEVFEADGRPTANDAVIVDASALEESRLQAYEQGYAAGWEDATKAREEDQTRVKADLARNIQGLGFTYHEARDHVLSAIGPLLQDLTERLLPDLAKQALAPVVAEALMPLVGKAADNPIELVMNPAARPAIESLLEQTSGLPLVLKEEPTLGEGQVYLRLGGNGGETRIDLDRALAEIATAVRDFFGQIKTEKQHG